MDPYLLESIIKAIHDSSFLCEDLREANKKASDSQPILAILLREILGDAVRIKNRLEEIKACFVEAE